MQGRARIESYLADAIEGCEELFQEHGESCTCEVCCLASNMIGSLRIFAMLLEIT